MQQSMKRAADHGAKVVTMVASTPMAAMVTLAHRLPMLFTAMTGSSSWADPELQRMMNEKIQAGWHASSDVGGAVLTGQRAVADYALEQTSANLAILSVSPLHPWQFYQFASASVIRLLKVSAKLGEAGGAVAEHGLKPAHNKVLANAKRLTRSAGKVKSR